MMPGRLLRFRVLIPLLIVIFIGILTPKTVSAQVLLQDDFSLSDDPYFYGVVPGTDLGVGSWAVVNGEYVVTTAPLDRAGDKPLYYATAGDKSWSNYKFEVKVDAVTSPDKIIYFRCNGYNNCYKLDIRNGESVGGNAIYFGYETGASYITDNFTLLKQVSFTNSLNTQYKVDVEAQNLLTGDLSIRVYIDDNFIFEQYIPGTDYPILTGNIALGALPGGGTDGVSVTKFDDVLVTAMDYATPTPAPTPVPTATPTPTVTPIPSSTPTPTPIPTATPTPSPVPTVAPIPTPTPIPTPVPVTIDKLIQDIENAHNQNSIPCYLFYLQLKVEALLAKLQLCKGKTGDAKATLQFMQMSLNAVDQRFILNGAKQVLLYDINYLIANL